MHSRQSQAWCAETRLTYPRRENIYRTRSVATTVPHNLNLLEPSKPIRDGANKACLKGRTNMSRSRGALSKAMVDKNYPHQVMLKNDAQFRKRLWEVSQPRGYALNFPILMISCCLRFLGGERSNGPMRSAVRHRHDAQDGEDHPAFRAEKFRSAHA